MQRFAVEVIVIVIGSVPIAVLSRRALLQPRSHGFYRFFAFELLLILIVLNAHAWFIQPFGPRQLASWLLLIGSAGLAVHGFHLLHAAGQPSEHAAEGALLDFERTTALVTVGAYRYIRHPLYASLLCLAWGAALKAITLPSVSLSVAASALLVVMAKTEERENVERFGDQYRTYMARTRMFVPWLW